MVHFLRVVVTFGVVRDWYEPRGRKSQTAQLKGKASNSDIGGELSVLQCVAGDSIYPLPILNRLCFIAFHCIFCETPEPRRSDVPCLRCSVSSPLNDRNDQDDEKFNMRLVVATGMRYPPLTDLGGIGWMGRTNFTEDSVAKHGVQRRYSSHFQWGGTVWGTNLYECHKTVQGLPGSGSSTHIHT